MGAAAPASQAAGARCAIHSETPATATCQRSGTFICGSCERRGPDGTVYCPPCFELLGLNEGAPTPWEDRERLGAVKGFFHTVKDVCFAPDRFWRSVDPTRNWVDALFFAWIANGLGTLIALPLTLLQFGSQMEALREQRDMPEELQTFFDLFSNPLAFAVILMVAVLLYPISFMFTAAFSHLGMMITGGNKNGFPATARAVGYASAPVLISSIPCVGAIGAIYYLVLSIWGLAAVHRTDWWRPLVGLLAVIFVFGCCFVGVAFAIGAAASGLR